MRSSMLSCSGLSGIDLANSLIKTVYSLEVNKGVSPPQAVQL